MLSSQIKRLGLVWFILTIALIGRAAGATMSLPLSDDLQALAKKAEAKHAVMVVFFVRPDCPYCKRVEKNHLAALAKAGQSASGIPVVVIKIDQTEPKALRDFSGTMTTHAQFSTSQKVSLVPVVDFYDTQGARLQPPLIGAMLDDFYAAYLDNAITAANQAQGGVAVTSPPH